MLTDDLALARRLLAQVQSVLTKLVAAAWLAEDLYALGEVMDVPLAGASAIRDVAQLTAQKRAVEAALRAELVPIASLMRQTASHSLSLEGEAVVPSWLVTLPLKPNHVINLMYHHYAEVTAAGDLPSHQFLTRYQQQRRLESDERMGWTDWVTDSIGCVLFGAAQPDAYVYVIRIHDIDGLITLVNLKRAALAQGINPEDLLKFLAASRECFHGPYTGSPISWDADSGEFYFVSLNPKSRYNRLRLWPAASQPHAPERSQPGGNP